ncbi:hypothetical protein [Nostoc sp.]
MNSQYIFSAIAQPRKLRSARKPQRLVDSGQNYSDSSQAQPY